MSVICPSGHTSATTDYCDQCGARINSTASPPSPTEVPTAMAEVETSPALRREPCPKCKAPRSADDRFCERCGYDFAAPPASTESSGLSAENILPSAAGGPDNDPASPSWDALATADERQFRRQATAGLVFPVDYVERRFPLTQATVRIGRAHAGGPTPEINLAPTPEDPGISHLHAMLERQQDGSYALRDLGSTNGTTVNDDPTPVGTETAVELVDGDQVRLGAWTTITLRKR